MFKCPVERMAIEPSAFLWRCCWQLRDILFAHGFDILVIKQSVFDTPNYPISPAGVPGLLPGDAKGAR